MRYLLTLAVPPVIFVKVRTQKALLWPVQQLSPLHFSWEREPQGREHTQYYCYPWFWFKLSVFERAGLLIYPTF
jgi:hypothetical protein